jgi:hypothetical protein
MYEVQKHFCGDVFLFVNASRLTLVFGMNPIKQAQHSVSGDKWSELEADH